MEMEWCKADEVAAIPRAILIANIDNSLSTARGGISIQKAIGTGSSVRSSAVGGKCLPSQQSWIPQLLEGQARRDTVSHQDTAGLLRSTVSNCTVGGPSGSRPYVVTCGDSSSAKFERDHALEVLLSSSELSNRAVHGWLRLYQERKLGTEKPVTIFALTLQYPVKYVQWQSVLARQGCSPIRDQRVTDELPPGPNHRWGLTLSDVGASCDKDASPRALLGERELPVRTSIEAGGQYDVLILCQLLKGEQIGHCQCVQETCLAGQNQKNVLLSADLRPVYQELILKAESSAPGSQPDACKALCPSFNDDIALSLRPDFEAGRGDKDRWVIDSSGPGFVEEPVFDKDFNGIASLETNPGFLGPSPSPRGSASGILLTAQTVGSGSGWNRADKLLYVINPITPQYESNESKEFETL